MAGSINKVILVGNLGKDPEIRYSQEGGKIATFSIATSETWKDRVTNEKRDNTQWHRIVVFNENLADVVEKYIKKGSKIYIEGSLQYRKYTGQDGVERNISEIVINRFRGDIQILDFKGQEISGDEYSGNNPGFSSEPPEKRASAAPSMAKTKPATEDADFDVDLDDDIPF